MKFLFVGTNPENTGGATHFVALAQALVEVGHSVNVVAYPGGLIAQELAHSDVRLHGAVFRNAYDLRGYAKVMAAAKQSKPDWLVGNFGKEYWPLIVIGRLLGVPVALFRHRTPPMKRLSGYLLPRLAQRFFAVSNYARQAYLNRGVPAGLVRVLYNPVSLARCRPDARQRGATLLSLGIDDEAIVLGYAGRMHGGKGIFTLLEAATAAMVEESRLHCLWLGDGPEAQDLRARATAGPAAARHHFVGWTHDVSPYYNAMSMLAFPSISPETFGRVSIEAQASGVPVLASNVGGVPETLSPDVTGLLLPPGDAGAWHSAILKMCDASFRRPMAEAARPYVQEHFSTTVIADEFVKILADH
ncbi:Glycosyltransferase involved in cell wall bisynthesis [Dyella sp. OK004]|uniref:glycosyltransferase family 4 protein n=1 Tax=Dyella sp. OK004 TaxID=1855292 RepID=UPI0008EF6E63|nr:glycosyltransferase family 4 protein [Dyella sp. OK004]SFS12160.1 Glycosyltransferase involved in cell wall bisynthesis [Dyella sp. OK004]